MNHSQECLDGGVQVFQQSEVTDRENNNSRTRGKLTEISRGEKFLPSVNIYEYMCLCNQTFRSNRKNIQYISQRHLWEDIQVLENVTD